MVIFYVVDKQHHSSNTGVARLSIAQPIERVSKPDVGDVVTILYQALYGVIFVVLMMLRRRNVVVNMFW